MPTKSNEVQEAQFAQTEVSFSIDILTVSIATQRPIFLYCDHVVAHKHIDHARNFRWQRDVTRCADSVRVRRAQAVAEAAATKLSRHRHAPPSGIVLSSFARTIHSVLVSCFAARGLFFTVFFLRRAHRSSSKR